MTGIIDGVDINKKIVSERFAFAVLKYYYMKSSDNKQAQIHARETTQGIWCDIKKKKLLTSKTKR